MVIKFEEVNLRLEVWILILCEVLIIKYWELFGVRDFEYF